jgi:hypothetical protein
VVFESENPPFSKVGDDIWFAKGGVESCKFAKGGLFSDPSSSPLTKGGIKTDEAIKGLSDNVQDIVHKKNGHDIVHSQL